MSVAWWKQPSSRRALALAGALVVAGLLWPLGGPAEPPEQRPAGPLAEPAGPGPAAGAAPALDALAPAAAGDPRGLDLWFEQNVGQYPEAVAFAVRGQELHAFLGRADATFVLPGDGDAPAWVLRLAFAGGDPVAVSGELRRAGASHHLVGNDPARWVTGAPHFGRVVQEDVWPGIDVAWRGDAAGLKFDVVLAPGADPGSVAFVAEGATAVRVDPEGRLVLETPAGPVVKAPPTTYQPGPDGPEPVASAYVVEGVRVGFAVGPHDPARPLVIDPLLYGAYLGGSDTDAAHAVAVDGLGFAYVTGFTRSVDFPSTPGVYQPTLLGAVSTAYVAKVNRTGTGLVYSTYLGGTVLDQGWGVAVDAQGNAYVAGSTGSPNFPVTVGAFQPAHGGGTSDGFVSKLSPDGSTLLYSTFLGGSAADNARGIAVDAAGNAYVPGDTMSTDFPTTPGALRTTAPGAQNGWVAKLNPTGTSAAYATYLGGSAGDQALAVAVDGAGAAYVAGSTSSADFPTTPGALRTTAPGGTNAFVARLAPSGAALGYATYLGGSAADNGRGIAVDATGNAYVTGDTQSTDFPATPGAYRSAPVGQDAFVAKLDPAGARLAFASLLGGSGQDTGRAIAVDGSGTAYLAGDTQSTDFPVTSGAIQPLSPPGQDAYATMFAPNGFGPMASTYYGGGAAEQAWGVAVDGACAAHLAGITSSTDIPVTPDAFEPDAPDGQNGFVAKMFRCLRPTAAFDATPAAACHNAPVTFAFLGLPGSPEGVLAQAAWDLGDGTVRTDAPPVASFQHAYATPGTHRAVLVVTDVFGFTARAEADVVAVNCPPGLDPVPPLVVYEEERVAFRLNASDANGDPLTFAMAGGLPRDARLDAATGDFTWTPAAGQAGTYRTLFTAADPYGMQDIEPFQIRVLPLPLLPQPVPPQSDADRDGLPDAHDACPAEAGTGDGCRAPPQPPAAPPTPPTPPAGASPTEGACTPPLPESATARLEDGPGVLRATVTWRADPDCLPHRFLVWNGTAGTPDRLVAVLPAEPGRADYAATDLRAWAEPHRYYVQAEPAPGPDRFLPARAVATEPVGVQPCAACGPATAPVATTPPVRTGPGLPVLPGLLGLAAVAAAALVPRVRSVLFVTFVRGASRLDRHDLLGHPVRAQVVDLVHAEPGIHDKELIRRLGRARGVTRYHVERLLLAGVLRERVSSGYRCYFPAAVHDPRVQEAGAVLRSDVARRLLQRLAQQPGIGVPALAAELGVDPSTVAYHLKKFEQAGLVDVRRLGRGARVYPLPLVGQALAALAL